jgi:peptide methionine sulfoxide reductase MsrB
MIINEGGCIHRLRLLLLRLFLSLPFVSGPSDRNYQSGTRVLSSLDILVEFCRRVALLFARVSVLRLPSPFSQYNSSCTTLSIFLKEPSFHSGHNKANVSRQTDLSLGHDRTEISHQVCFHLSHNEAPAPCQADISFGHDGTDASHQACFHLGHNEASVPLQADLSFGHDGTDTSHQACFHLGHNGASVPRQANLSFSHDGTDASHHACFHFDYDDK